MKWKMGSNSKNKQTTKKVLIKKRKVPKLRMKGYIMIKPTDIPRLIRKYYNQLYTNEYNNLHELSKLLE